MGCPVVGDPGVVLLSVFPPQHVQVQRSCTLAWASHCLELKRNGSSRSQIPQLLRFTLELHFIHASSNVGMGTLPQAKRSSQSYQNRGQCHSVLRFLTSNKRRS